jgi:hypothetical protein
MTLVCFVPSGVSELAMSDPTTVLTTLFLHPSDNKRVYIDCTRLLDGRLIDSTPVLSVVDGTITATDPQRTGAGGVTVDGGPIAENKGFSFRVSGMNARTRATVRAVFALNESGETLGLDIVFKCQQP